MPRVARMIINGSESIYHIITRTCLDNYPFDEVDKDEMVKIIIRYSSLYFTEIMGYCIMGSHIHLLVKMIPGENYTDEKIKKRYIKFYGKEKEDMFSSEKIPFYREKWSKLSEYMKDIKQTISRFYNKRHGRRGTLWGERFKSVIVEKGHTLINCLAYIDLNPIRGGLVDRPEGLELNRVLYSAKK